MTRTHSRRAFLAHAGLAAAALVLGCGGEGNPSTRASPPRPTAAAPSPTSIPTAGPTLPLGAEHPNDILIEGIGDVREDDMQEILHAAEAARDFYHETLALYVDGPVHIKVLNVPDVPIHAATYQREGAPISSISVNVANTTWLRESPTQRRRVVAHEYFHVIQHWLSQEDKAPDELFFLVEGAAEYAGYATVIAEGLMTDAQVQHGLVVRARVDRPKVPPLEQLTSASAGSERAKYAVAHLAVHQLAGRSNLTPLARYFLLRREQPPSAAFEAAFGQALDAFYSAFALWRSTQGI
jgi:hypothetical protein